MAETRSFKKCRGLRAIDDAMVAGKRDRHHRANARLAVDRDHAIGDASHGENRGLRRRDDRAERIDLVHPQIADGERPAGNIGGPQTPGLGALGKILALRSGDLRDVC